MRNEIAVKTSRIYCDIRINDAGIININSQETIHYLLNVLRSKVGDKVRVFNPDDGEYICCIQSIISNKQGIILQLLEQLRHPHVPSTPIVLGMSIIKNMGECVDIATQMGADIIVPVIAQRSQLRSVNVKKLTKIMISSAEQSERLSLPLLLNPMLLTDFLSQYQNVVVANEHHTAQEPSILEKKTDIVNANPVAMLVGPEGGFTTQECHMFHESQCISIKLHENILRAELAVGVLLAQMQMLLYNQFAPQS